MKVQGLMLNVAVKRLDQKLIQQALHQASVRNLARMFHVGESAIIS